MGSMGNDASIYSSYEYAPPSTKGITLPTPPLTPAKVRKPRTITELISIRARDLPDEPIFGYPSTGLDYTEYTFPELEALSIRAARKYASLLPVRTDSSEDARVIGLLGPSTLDYFVTLLALSRLGFTVLFLSTRISEAAYLSLLEATGCRHMVVSPSFMRTICAVQRSLPELQTIDFLPQSEYDTDGSIDVPPQGLEQTLDLDQETTKVAWIIHSSGSTGLPKPIYQTHYSALRNYENNMNLKGFVILPLFHAFGLSNVFRGFTAVKKIYIYSASLPLTSQNLLQVMRQHKFEIFITVPYALKLLSETQEGIDALAAMKMVQFGGSACPDALGDRLTEGGVKLISHYGSTETGQLMTSTRPDGDKAWNYVRVHEKLAPFIRWEARGGNLHELVVLKGWPSKVATNRPDGAYALKDLFEPHPSIEGAWKYCGRLDDTIVLMNGEKAIPIAMEQAVRQHKMVKETVMFGAGKSQVGMIVIASEFSAGKTTDELIDAILPVIAAENLVLPAYAQLSRDMIRVLPIGTEYPQTDKGTIVRQAFYRAFQNQIDEVYQEAESRSRGTRVLEGQELRAFLREQILELTTNSNESQSLSDDTDLFSLGVDSLQSTRLRAKILKEIQLNGNALPQNVVFEYPTIAKLAEAIVSIRDSKAIETQDVMGEMERLVSKYSIFPQHVPVAKTSDQTCVVVTGVTGSLGAHVVAQLVRRPYIKEVCCLVRAESDVNAERRVIESMQAREVYNDLLPKQRCKISCYQSDFSKPKLGLSDAVYDNLSQRITSLIHSAWSVNFNKNLSSFEADCIAGARNLMLLCLSAQQPQPASFNFCSSVSTVVNTQGDVVPEALPESFRCAQGMGYAQSKLVTENLIARAAIQTGMSARVLRIGQIVADTQNGIWNATEAIPLMLQAATTIGALPALDESPRWLPVDTVAKSVIDISLPTASSATFFNVVNPRTFHWTNDLLPALRASGLKFEEVGQREWVARLRKSNPDPVANPTIKLVEFFANKYDNDMTKRRNLGYDTRVTELAAPVLSHVPALQPELVQKFVSKFLSTRWAPRL
ncbi:uncharacterized protein A1O9_03975 [Exophiala aquamarina CBS 119918]|uniref:Carrier domain-containing protein n=1 Tax=Exophiala aquamarina CBS 119918 TaxID=1182545 RepID=A0A072PGY7_9EURO|nr:uncharacterized protein A1O9_03975 [Exophiala aquamarina CBS 119918]KEF59131.1 hypothetical protein A1O9_03975 [Exophiala aquamarina CBS 119918]